MVKAGPERYQNKEGPFKPAIRVIKEGDKEKELLSFWSKGPFPLRAWKRAFFVSFIDLRLKRAVKIKASAKKSNKTNKECFFPRS